MGLWRRGLVYVEEHADEEESVARRGAEKPKE